MATGFYKIIKSTTSSRNFSFGEQNWTDKEKKKYKKEQNKSQMFWQSHHLKIL